MQITNAFNAFCKSIEHNVWFRVLLIAVTVLLLVSAYNKMQRYKGPMPYSGKGSGLGSDSFMESFIQNGGSGSSSSNIIVKKDADTKDAFYAAVHDQIFNQKVNNAYEVGAIINKYPDISNQTVALYLMPRVIGVLRCGCVTKLGHASM